MVLALPHAETQADMAATPELAVDRPPTTMYAAAAAVEAATATPRPVPTAPPVVTAMQALQQSMDRRW